MTEDRVAPASANKPWREMTEQELRENLGFWTLKVETAAGWGAALGFAAKCQKAALRELRRRGLTKEAT